MKNLKSVRLLAGVIGLGLILMAGGCGSAKTTETAEEKYIPVEVQSAAVQNLLETTNFSGKVNSNQDLSLVPKMPGKVSSVNVQVGDRVGAGTVLFTLDTADLQKSVDSASIGVSMAETGYQQTKEKIDLAKKNLERQQGLYEAGAISKAQLETFESQASDTPLQTAQLQVDQARMGLQQAQDALHNAVVTAPVEGTVTAVNVKVGEMASSAQPAVKMTQLGSLYVDVNVPENIVNSVQLGQEAKVTITSANAQEIKGVISSIAPAADVQTKLYAIKVAIDNQDGKIKPGMFAKAEIVTNTKSQVLAVNSEAVVSKNGKYFIYVVENDAAVEREVTTGLDAGAMVEVTKGLKPDEQVIIKGQTLVKQGSKVKIVGGEES
ncbi:efflux RND transporter periplasmic adaptor subunit [Desulfitobacterium sp.]|uniref:efflux RND transporter periplasmic adaptor subunit n=1 Tax=Desulfitobacterium sp. TaxID=49981 RepID=UPI002B20579D|nr:efflux RND transporter periplasmic adaptor subunit [Desulfitobacterium sp.]MEA4900331.1 efflux RND transporter periplasmic adaptor subunit [Desulfitobacterium sp.]